MRSTLFSLAFIVAGLFTLALGSVHFFFPRLFDFEHAIPRAEMPPPLKPLRLEPLRYATRRRDVHGIAWAMNHAASYVLVSIGLLDLASTRWLSSDAGRWLVLWIAGWWFLRAASHLYLERRRGDLSVGLPGAKRAHLRQRRAQA